MYQGNTAFKVQEDHYYPFGMRLGGMSGRNGQDNKFLYNGKEHEDDFDLNWYHYGVRYYDPQLGRWHAIDPADEFFSPYVYCHNDPVNFLDPDGAEESFSEAYADWASDATDDFNKEEYMDVPWFIRWCPGIGAAIAGGTPTMGGSWKKKVIQDQVDMLECKRVDEDTTCEDDLIAYKKRTEKRQAGTSGACGLVGAGTAVTVTVMEITAGKVRRTPESIKNPTVMAGSRVVKMTGDAVKHYWNVDGQSRFVGPSPTDFSNLPNLQR